MAQLTFFKEIPGAAYKQVQQAVNVWDVPLHETVKATDLQIYPNDLTTALRNLQRNDFFQEKMWNC